MSIGLFVGCGDGIKERNAKDMIVLHTWYFTSGLQNNAIVLKHSEENAVFNVSVDKGRLWTMGEEQAVKNTAVKPGETLHWDFYELETSNAVEHAYVEIILSMHENIVGYSVIEINKKSASSLDYNAKVLRAALFPKVSGKYQEISDEQVKTIIERMKTEKGER